MDQEETANVEYLLAIDHLPDNLSLPNTNAKVTN
jgi:hypothetical protein